MSEPTKTLRPTRRGRPTLALVAALLIPLALAGCESTPEKGDDEAAAVPEADRTPPTPERDRTIDAPPFTRPKAKERPGRTGND